MGRIVVATGPGGPEVLSVLEVPTAVPGDGEVVVAIRAAGTNPIDVKLYGPEFGPAASAFPMRLGLEAAGVVTAVDASPVGPAGPVRVGDEVIVYPVHGAYADELAVPASTVIPKPASIDFDAASGLMLAGTTAIHALAATSVGAGDVVVVHGASGGVGLLLIQLAVARGAVTIGTASLENHPTLERLGAIPVVYGPGLVDRLRDAAHGAVTVAIDAVGTDEAVDASLALVEDRTRIATIAASRRALADGFLTLGHAPGSDPGTAIRDAARMELARAAGEGSLHVTVARSFPLTDAASAHAMLREGHAKGKIVLLP